MSLPLNSIAWTLGSIALGIFSVRCYRNYQATRNPIAGSGAYIGLFFCISFFWFGVPAFFTRDPQILRVTYSISHFFTILAYLAQAYLLWFLGLRSRVRLSVVMTVVAIFAAITMVMQIQGGKVMVTSGLIPVQYFDPHPLATLKAILYFGISASVGFLFIRLGYSEKLLKARLRSIAIGLVFIVVSAARALNYLTIQGRETVAAATADIIMFSIFLIALLAPTIWHSFHAKLSTKTS